MPAWLTPRPLKWRIGGLVVGWALVATVAALSLAPALPQVDIRFFDKVGHFLAYFTLMAWFGFLCLKHVHAWVALLLIGMGLALECAQHLTGYRAFELLDIAANTLGVAVGFALARTRPFGP